MADNGGARRRSGRRWLWIVAGIAAAGTVCAVVGIWHLPDRMYPGTSDGAIQARAALQGGLLTAAAALTAVAGGLIALDETRRANANTHVRELYATAISQLGADSLDIRLGGIYALERIATDSPADQRTVVEVLSAFVREHTRPPTPTRRSPPGRRWTRPTPDGDTPPRPATDVQAAITVLGRLPTRPDLPRADLTDATLTGAVLDGADLTGAVLDDADLTGAVLDGADLTRAVLDGADLTRARLDGADLTRARLDNATLTRAWLRRATLTDAQLNDATLTRARLHEATLTDAQMVKADLTRAWLIVTNLTDAQLHRATLTGAQLNDANLTRARLHDADLTDAQMKRATLTDAWLHRANLTHARLHDADLTDAVLDDADLTDAWLHRANLTHARLHDADLTDARLHRANLTGARLDGADLTGALGLVQAQIDDARGDAETRLSAGLVRPASWTAEDDAGGS